MSYRWCRGSLNMEHHSLNDIYNDMATDKGTWHSYIGHYYNDRFAPFKDKKINFLEIGIHRGASLKLWRNFFTRAVIFGIDIDPESIVIGNAINNTVPGVIAEQFDAYFRPDIFYPEVQFDIIIDDGPHDVESQMFAAEFWTKRLVPGGILVIEDIQDMSHINLILDKVPEGFNTAWFDYRHIKNRYDDILIEITRKG